MCVQRADLRVFAGCLSVRNKAEDQTGLLHGVAGRQMLPQTSVDDPTLQYRDTEWRQGLPSFRRRPKPAYPSASETQAGPSHAAFAAGVNASQQSEPEDPMVIGQYAVGNRFSQLLTPLAVGQEHEPASGGRVNHHKGPVAWVVSPLP